MRRIKILLMVVCGIVVSAQCQYNTLPVDTAVKMGKLENGLSYIMRHNSEPKGRAHFYIVQNVGAILEEDSQNGLAHFLEHMAFNGSTHFPGKGIIEYMESIGAKFGVNVNAYTSLDETVYMLRNIPVPRPTVVDSALLIMRDWSTGITLDGDEIDKERGVIREEWRTGSSANRRMWAKGNAKKYPGSQYAKRDVIGDTAVINNFEYDTLRAYYKKWYRPDQQCVVAVGDFDVAYAIEALKRAFRDVPPVTNAAKRVIYPIAANETPIVSVVTDVEATATTLGLEFKKDTLSPQMKNSAEGYLKELVRGLVCGMLQERLNEAARKPTCPYVDSYVAYGNVVRSQDAFMVGVVAKTGKEKEAFEAMVTELERMKRYGFSEEELQRAKAEHMASLEKAYNERDKMDSRAYMEEYKRVFLDKEPTPGIAWELSFTKEAYEKRISSVIVNKMAMGLVTKENLIVDISGPEKLLEHTTEEELEHRVLRTIDSITGGVVEPRVEKQSNRPLLDKQPKAGEVKERRYVSELGVTEWTMDNGIKVLLKPTTFKDDEVCLLAYSKGGTSLYDKNLESVAYADDIVAVAGLGKHSVQDLERMLAGRRAGASAYISTYGEGVKGSSTVKDMELLFTLAYMRMTSPRRDKEAFQTLQAGLREVIEGREKDPQSAYGDTIAMMMSQHSPRTLLMERGLEKRLSDKRALKVYKERFKNPADFTFIVVGNFDLDTIEPMVCKYIGSFKTKKGASENWKDNGVRMPAGKVNNTFARAMATKQTSVYMNQWANMPYTLQNQVTLQALKDVLSIRYTQSLREEEGGTYGAHVRSSLTNCPQEQASLQVTFDTDPAMADRLIGIAWAEIDSIAAKGPRADDLAKTKLNMEKQYQESTRENGWWLGTLREYDEEGIDRYNTYLGCVRGLTVEAVRDLTRALLAEGNRMEVVMKPE